MHNVDYLEFLVSKVWRIDRHPLKIVEFGCGYGRFASMLLPLVASGSSYTGFDSAAALVSREKRFSRNRLTRSRSYEATCITLHFATANST